MTTESFTPTHFYHKIILKADLPTVFQSISTAEGLCSWFLGTVVFSAPKSQTRPERAVAQKGDAFHWKWLGKEFSIEGTVLNLQPHKSIGLTFGPSFEVEIHLRQAKDGRTMLTLQQKYTADIPAHFTLGYINCSVSWVFFLTNLKSVLEHGIDLRETEFEDESFINQ